MPRSIDNRDDIIDSRDVIARIEELTEQEERDSDETEELAALRRLEDQCEGYCADWHHGETLIRESYFKRYAQELAKDCGMLENANAWPLTCIDWEQAARELAQDYTEVDFGGVAYYVR